jgi:hypothetical protein
LRREKCKVINVKFLRYFSVDQITVTKCVIHLERHCHPVSVCRVIVLEALILEGMPAYLCLMIRAAGTHVLPLNTVLFMYVSRTLILCLVLVFCSVHWDTFFVIRFFIDFILYGGKVLLDKHKCCRLEMFLFHTVQIGAVPLLLY